MSHERGRPRPPERRPTAPTGRELAGKVLVRIAKEDAWASRALDAELTRAQTSPSEAARATDIVFGVLRAQRGLDAIVARACTKGSPTEAVALATLRAATYELTHTEADSHAVVDGWVGFVKRERGEGLARFVNAVLRKLASARVAPTPVVAVLPPWMKKLAERSLGPERAAAFVTALAEPPFLALRARAPEEREALVQAIASARPDAEVRAGTLSPLAVLVRGAGDPRKLPGYGEGRFSVQDEGSQVIAAALGAQPGESVVDACSGRGGKTLALADAVGPTGRVTAIDVSEPKLDQMGREMRRLAIEKRRVTSHAVDLTVGLGGLPERSFDRVLIDAPCSGLGTLGRRPELMLRLTEADPARMAELQAKILESALRLVKPGGRVVYAVCSFADVEVSSAASLVRDAEPAAPAADADGVVRVGPFLSNEPMDTYQLVIASR